MKSQGPVNKGKGRATDADHDEDVAMGNEAPVTSNTPDQVNSAVSEDDIRLIIQRQPRTIQIRRARAVILPAPVSLSPRTVTGHPTPLDMTKIRRVRPPTAKVHLTTRSITRCWTTCTSTICDAPMRDSRGGPSVLTLTSPHVLPMALETSHSFPATTASQDAPLESETMTTRTMSLHRKRTKVRMENDCEPDARTNVTR